jgi:peptidoglycan hydrolase CwlO-like protein
MAMPADLPDRRLGAPWMRALLVAALAVAIGCGLTLAAVRAPAQRLEERLGERRAQLEQAEQRREGVAASIEGLNAEVDALLGEVSALQRQRDAVRERLAAKQGQLDRATAELERQRRRLETARQRLRRALVVLRRRLVAIYKAGTPDTIGIVLGSESWSEAVAEMGYVREVQEHDDAMIGRVRALRDAAREGVQRMDAVRDRLRAARDAIAAEERQLAATQATLNGQFAELRAAQAEREALLATLGARVDELRGEVSALGERLEARQSAAAGSAAPSAPPPAPGSSAELLPNGLAAAPADAPPAVVAAIDAANQIAHTPYVWGGGHGSFESPGYDCSGAVSYALNGGGFLDSPLDSTGLSFWGEPGYGSWITVYANSGHAYAVIAGLRWDTSDGAGPRWHADMRSGAGYVARHPPGY